jgi:hypothetical protein
MTIDVNRKKNISPADNRLLAKKRVQSLNEALCFASSSVLADSFVLKILSFAKRQKVSNHSK